MNDHGARQADTARTADAVRAFYERHPYPPPLDDLDRYRARWADPLRRRADFHLFWPREIYRENVSILIAGCGTSQAAKYALRWPRAQVTGIDVSSTSIEKTEKLKRKYRLDNLTLLRLPVERAAELDRSFKHVVCTGVLHHLRDPDAGLRALRQVLDPQGAMHLMVYAPYGRTGIYMLQEYCRTLGIGTSPAEIRDLAASLEALPQHHPIVPLLRNSPDFQTEAGLADALLHPQDRSYSVPELLDFLARNGLQFARWLRQAPYLPHCGALVKSPHHPLLARLPVQEQNSALELFRGTMVRHTATVCRDDYPGEPQPISFDGHEWVKYVPIRLPDTICVEERLPPAAAGVLINRAHTDTDLYLPIDATEKSLFETIDGRRAIDTIATTEEQRRHAQVLFERLWWYDQVVFDASPRTGQQRADEESVR